VGKRLLFISGQVGVAPDGRVAEDFSTQAEQAMDNVEALLVAARMTIAEVVKLTYYVTNSQNLATLGEIRRRRWSSRTPPAVTALVIAGLARSEYLIEIEAIAAAN
jgi:enamine deaminase RidA (YjgF/YER057c/UK114 family)